MSFDQQNNKGSMRSNMFNKSVLPVSFAEQNYSQDFSQLSRIQFNCRADYSNAERKILECVYYLTSTPLDVTDTNRGHAEMFLLLWMNGTSDYTFNMNQTVCSIIESNVSLLSTYIAFYAKYVIEHSSKSKDEDEVCKNVVSSLLCYCKNYNINMMLNGLLIDILKKEKRVS